MISLRHDRYTYSHRQVLCNEDTVWIFLHPNNLPSSVSSTMRFQSPTRSVCKLVALDTHATSGYPCYCYHRTPGCTHHRTRMSCLNRLRNASCYSSFLQTAFPLPKQGLLSLRLSNHRQCFHHHLVRLNAKYWSIQLSSSKVVILSTKISVQSMFLHSNDIPCLIFLFAILVDLLIFK